MSLALAAFITASSSPTTWAETAETQDSRFVWGTKDPPTCSSYANTHPRNESFKFPDKSVQYHDINGLTWPNCFTVEFVWFELKFRLKVSPIVLQTLVTQCNDRHSQVYLSLNIDLQILHTDLHTFPLRPSWENCHSVGLESRGVLIEHVLVYHLPFWMRIPIVNISHMLLKVEEKISAFSLSLSFYHFS